MKVSLIASLLSISLGVDRVLSEQPVCTESTTCDEEPPCKLWLAESTLNKGLLGLFSGIEVEAGDTVGESELLIPMYDANVKEWSPWHEIVWDESILESLLLQNHYNLGYIIPGIGSNIICSNHLGNINSRDEEYSEDNLDVHRSKDPTAGSFGYRHGFQFIASLPLVPGQEIFINCDEAKHGHGVGRRIVKSLRRLEDTGLCLDQLEVKPSTLPGVGRGAFAKRRVKKLDIIMSTPVVQFDRSQMEIVKQYKTDKGMKHTDHVEHHQLLLNYCYGHPNSTVLLLPLGPGVNFVNHNRSPNAVLDWSESPLSDEDLLDLSASEVLEKEKAHLLVDLVALRDIEPGEEIFIDYGREWERAWEAHKETWQPPANSENYISAADYKRTHHNEPIRTVEEQNKNPYPENIMTACLFQEDVEEGQDENEDAYDAETEAVYWNNDSEGCLRPCKIMTRKEVNGRVFYDVEVEEITNKLLVPDHCELSKNQKTVLRTPEKVITLVDKEYSSDQQLANSFRHEIGTPEDMYPENWMMHDPEPMGDFALPKLKPGQVETISWAEDGEIVAPNAHLIGLSPNLRHGLLDYCERMGITEAFRDLTYRGNALKPGTNENRKFQDKTWFIQRPDPHWKSNMHWISPSNAESQNDYLRALSAAGFDDVLKSIGEHFGFEGLAAYHITFIAVSHCIQGYLHYDVSETGAKVFNVIIPLLLANETGPELDLQADREKYGRDAEVGRLRYEYDVASMMGDDAYVSFQNGFHLPFTLHD